jgi:hypothetical protein
MSRIVSVFVLALVIAFAAGSQSATAQDTGGTQSKAGPIKSVNAKAKSFVLDLELRPLTFTVNSDTTITLDGKASTFEAAIKVGMPTVVAYMRSGDDRIATRVQVKTPR